MTSAGSDEVNDQPKAQTPDRFEIGLCMAGAISAGAYTAGVVDFLFEALDAWCKVKKEWKKASGKAKPGGPLPPQPALMHDTVITCISGASAGGMTAAAIVSALCGEYEPVTGFSNGQPQGKSNTPYQCWVESVGIEDFLKTGDIKNQEMGNVVVRSLLDCTILDTVGGKYMKPAGEAKCRSRDYIAPDLAFFLTLANLNGVGYTIRFKGGTGYGHEMALHKDYLQFKLSRTDHPGGPPTHELTRVPLKPMGVGSDDIWDDLKTAALATGAFPLALAPREILREKDEYLQREWPIPRLVCQGGCTITQAGTVTPVSQSLYRFEPKNIPPDWDNPASWRSPYPAPMNTLNVDGGAFDNEPLELVRRHLAGTGMSNPREPHKAHKAVVLVDPFPHDDREAPPNSYQDVDVLKLALRIIAAMKANARFKPEELVLAQEEDCYSRFLIGPSRSGKGRDEADIACGSMGGFGGFFSRGFRQHDYQLGRRNCQWFLHRHFVIPLADAKKNLVFKSDRAILDAFSYHVPKDAPRDGAKAATDAEPCENEPVVPIIPLMDHLCPVKLAPPDPARKKPRNTPQTCKDQGNPVEALSWEALKLDKDALVTKDRERGYRSIEDLIEERIRAVADVYIKQALGGFTGWLANFFFLSDKYGELARLLVDKVKEDFQKAGVMKK